MLLNWTNLKHCTPADNQLMVIIFYNLDHVLQRLFRLLWFKIIILDTENIAGSFQKVHCYQFEFYYMYVTAINCIGIFLFFFFSLCCTQLLFVISIKKYLILIFLLQLELQLLLLQPLCHSSVFYVFF